MLQFPLLVLWSPPIASSLSSTHIVAFFFLIRSSLLLLPFISSPFFLCHCCHLAYIFQNNHYMSCTSYMHLFVKNNHDNNKKIKKINAHIIQIVKPLIVYIHIEFTLVVLSNAHLLIKFIYALLIQSLVLKNIYEATGFS